MRPCRGVAVAIVHSLTISHNRDIIKKTAQTCPSTEEYVLLAVDTDALSKAIASATELAKPVVETACGFATSLLGEPFRVAGSSLADHMYAWQTRNRIRILIKTRDRIKASGIGHTHIATGFLLHALEAAGNAENDGLQDLWARLLAGAVQSESANVALHIETLRKLSPEDAIVVDAMATLLRDRLSLVPAEARRPEEIELIWRRALWIAERPPNPELREIWSPGLARLEAVNVLQSDASRSARELTGLLARELDSLRFVHLDEHPMGRLTDDLTHLSRRPQGRLMTPYGMDLVSALGLTETQREVPDDEA